MAIENLLTYTEVDSAGDITVSTSAAVFDTMRRDAVSYVVNDFGASYFGPFEIDFEAKIDLLQDDSIAVLCGVSNTLGTFNDMIVANDMIGVWAYGSNAGTNLTFYLTDRSTGPSSDTYIDGGSSSILLYFTMKRVGTTATLNVYSDSGRTVLVDALSVTCETETKRYLYVLASRQSGTDAGDIITGYTQNVEIIGASISSSSSSSSVSSSSSSTSSSSSSSTTYQLVFRDSYDNATVHRNVWYDGTRAIEARDGAGTIIFNVTPSSGELDILYQIDPGSASYRNVSGYDDLIFYARLGSGLQSATLSPSLTALTFLDTDDQGGSYQGVFADENLVYCACSTDGLRTYTYDVSGNLFFEDRHDAGADSWGVWGDGRYIYVADGVNGIRSYYVAPDGTINLRDSDDQGGTYYNVWGDGTFVYTATSQGIRSYSVSPIGNLTYIDTKNDGDVAERYRDVWGDGTWIFTVKEQDGILAYTVDGSGNLKHETVNGPLSSGLNHVGMWGGGGFIYVINSTAGLWVYEMFSSSSSSSSSISISSSSESSSSSSISSSSLSSSSSSSTSSSSSSTSSSSSSSSSSQSSSSSSWSSSSATWEATRIRRRYKGSDFEQCGLSPEDYYEFIEWLEDRFIYSSSSQSSSSLSSSSTSISSSSQSSVSSSSSSTSSSSSSTSSSSSSSSVSSSSSSISSSSSVSSSSESLSSSSTSSSSESFSFSVSSSSTSSSSESISFSSSSVSSSSKSSSSFSCFITPDDDFDQPNGTEPDVQRWFTVGNMIVSGGQLVMHVDGITNMSKAETTWFMDELTDFDVQTDWAQISVDPSSGWNIGFEVLQADNQRGTRVYKRAHTTTITEEMVSAGGIVNSTNVTSSITSGGFRITRIGDSWQSYYWNGSWVAIGGPYIVNSNDYVNAALYLQNFTSTPDVLASFDNFSLVSGGFLCPPSSSSSSSSTSSSSSSSSSSESSSSSSVSSSSSSSTSSSSLSSSSSVSSSSLSSSSESESISISSSSTSSP